MARQNDIADRVWEKAREEGLLSEDGKIIQVEQRWMVEAIRQAIVAVDAGPRDLNVPDAGIV